MRGNLTKETRLGISVTRLKASVVKLRLQVKELTLQLKERDARIAQLTAKLEDKDSQRKELLTYLYKPKRKDRIGKPRGKKPGTTDFSSVVSEERPGLYMKLFSTDFESCASIQLVPLTRIDYDLSGLTRSKNFCTSFERRT